MPTPRPKESKQKFIGRCMAYPDLRSKPPKARAGECYGIFRQHRGDSADKSAPAEEEKSVSTDYALQQTQEDQARRAMERRKRIAGMGYKALKGLLQKNRRLGKLICDVSGEPIEEIETSEKTSCGGECACQACQSEKALSEKNVTDDSGHEHGGDGKFVGHGGGSGGGSDKDTPASKPQPQPKKRIFERGEEIAKSHNRAINNVLADVQSGKLDHEKARARILATTDKAADAASKNFNNRYVVFRDRIAEQFGAASLETPEWEAVKDTFRKGRDAAVEFIRGIGSDAEKAVKAYAAKGAFPPGTKNDLARDADSLAELHIEFAGKMADAFDTFRAKHQGKSGSVLTTKHFLDLFFSDGEFRNKTEKNVTDDPALESETDKAILAPVPHHPTAAGQRAVAGSIMTPRQRLVHYDTGKKEWTFEAKPGEPLTLVGYEPDGTGMRVRNRKGQEMVVGSHVLRFVRHPHGHKLPKESGKEEPYQRDNPDQGGGGTCKPGQTAAETGCSPKSYGIMMTEKKETQPEEAGS